MLQKKLRVGLVVREAQGSPALLAIGKDPHE